MENFYSVLQKCPLFKEIRVEDYTLLLSCIQSHIKNYKAKEYIFLTGDTIHQVGIVLTGSLEILKENPAGVKHIISFLEPSDIFAEGIVCTPGRISPVAVHVKEDSKVLLVPFERIIRSCGNACSFHFQLIKNMMLLLGEKNYSMNYKIELLTLKGMREKLASFLLHEASLHGSMTFQILPNRNELADYLNVSRTSMCRELARMKDLGMLDYYQNSFKILSPDALRECLLS